MNVLLAFANLVVGPGFVQALSGRWRIAIAWVVALLAATTITAFTVWGLVLLMLTFLGSIAEAALGLRRLAPPIRWNVVAAVAVAVGTIAVFVMVRLFVLEAFKFPSSSMSPTYEIGDHVFADKLAVKLRAPRRGEPIVFAMPCDPRRDYLKRVIALGGDTVEIRCNKLYINGAVVDEQLVAAHDTYSELDERANASFPRTVSRYRETLGDHSYETFHDDERPQRDSARAAGSAAIADGRDFPTTQLRSCANQEMGGVTIPEQAPGEIVDVFLTRKDECSLHRHYVVPADHVFVMGDNRSNSNDSRYFGSVPLQNVRGIVRGVWWPLGHFGGRD
jgi:signal peptidase I